MTSPHGELGIDCNQCHSVAGWRELLADPLFDHEGTQFPLSGRHAQVGCRLCHSSLRFSDAALECAQCHTDIHRAQFAAACEICHTPDGWDQTLRMGIHHQDTRFPLIGVHANLDCRSCHAGGSYVNVSGDCEACHIDAFRSTTSPDHSAVGFSLNCRQCHQVTAGSWRGVAFEHTGDFPLTGGHSLNDCASCHERGNYSISAACYFCHADDFAATTNPDHEQSGFSQTCETCHTAQGWSPAAFDHNLSAFPLTGAHLSVNCLSCHAGGQYTGTSSDCFVCHEADYRSSDNPDHETSQFPTTCATCHTADGWAPALFDHNLSDFPLTGAHVSVSCAECHLGGQYTNTTADCYGCHAEEYQSSDNPDHEASQFPTTCAVCHSISGWSPASFDHSQTEFPLTGAHVSVNCLACHIDGQYSNTPTDCYACHDQDYANTTNPDHETSQFPTSCAVCHNTQGWSPASFDHSQTEFPLTGAHVSVNCLACHIDGQYSNTPTDCYACHDQDYANTTNPDHEVLQFPTACLTCHTTSGWSPASFDHSQTEFPLTGAHVSVNCLACHIDGQYSNTPTDCYACHDQDYAQAADHAQNQYPHDCAICHNTGAWVPSTFDHDDTEFPLTGAHVQTNCSDCHIGGQFEGTPTDCYFCHEEEYDEATDPDHQSAGFPTTCQLCHNTSDWEDANFNHDGPFFPIYSGRHEGEWNTCSDCHTNPNNYAVFCCTNCHEHNQSDTDEDHDEVGNYVYNCTSCFNCHPDGEEGPSIRQPRRRGVKN